MYLNHFGFRKKPFHITPDPEFLYLSPSHKEALGSILYGIKERMGFIAITGEVGTGKTTIVRSFLDQIDPEEILPVYIFNAKVSFQDLLDDIFNELGLADKSGKISDMIHQLNITLIEKYKNNQNIILIIDEAQGMPEDTLEQLRILSNLETTKEKLLQIILVGQPELDDKLHRKGLRQLRQRIAIRALIKPLSEQESFEYIQHRLSKVTDFGEEIFSKNALGMIVKHAHGVPRVINTLCDNALIATFGYQEHVVRAKIVTEVVDDYYEREEPIETPEQFVSGKHKQSLFTALSHKSMASLVLVALVITCCTILGIYLYKNVFITTTSHTTPKASVTRERPSSSYELRRKAAARAKQSRSAVDRHVATPENDGTEAPKNSDDKQATPSKDGDNPASDTSMIQVFK